MVAFLSQRRMALLYNSGRTIVKDKMIKRFDFGNLGIWLGILFVIASVVWIVLLNMVHDDDKSSGGITWVG